MNTTEAPPCLERIPRNGRPGNQVDDSGAEILDDNGDSVPVSGVAPSVGVKGIGSLECGGPRPRSVVDP